ncbi:MAG: hypothetical protein Q4D27_09220 [Coriobacteriia bacterium]|nr:hypothetical protein [Coriobacteriia bacterium]
MGYNLGVCPQCNNVMSMPDDSAIVRCPTCQSEVSAAEAAALAGANSQMGAQQQPQNPYGAAAGTTYPVQPTYGAGAPLLATWQTNVLFTVLGILATMAVNGFLGGSVDANGQVHTTTMSGIFALIYLAFIIVYAVKIYPSYFTEKPMIESSEAISFLNAFVGGIIFGLLWNHNLTLKNKGISHIVFVVLIAATFALVFLLLMFGAMAVMAGAVA